MIIFRYLAKEILSTMLAITLLVLVILVTNQSVRFLHYAASGGLPANQLLYLTALQVPLLLGYLMPLGLYLAVLLTLARLHLDSEMVVLSACGVSRWKLTRMLLAIAFFVACFVFWLMMVAVPRAQGDIGRVIQSAKSHLSAAEVVPGHFMVFDDGHNHMIFYAKNADIGHNVLRQVFLASKKSATQRGQSSWSVLTAETAQDKHFSGDPESYLLFKNGYRYLGVPGTQDYHVYKFKRLVVHVSSKNVPRPYAVSSLSMGQLWKKARVDLNAVAQLQWRLAMPISVLVFTLLAIPLSEVKPRYGKFGQLFPAMLIYLAYADSILSARNTIADGRLSPHIGMWLTHGLALLLAGLLIAYRAYFHRIKRWVKQVVI